MSDEKDFKLLADKITYKLLRTKILCALSCSRLSHETRRSLFLPAGMTPCCLQCPYKDFLGCKEIIPCFTEYEDIEEVKGDCKFWA